MSKFTPVTMEPTAIGKCIVTGFDSEPSEATVRRYDAAPEMYDWIRDVLNMQPQRITTSRADDGFALLARIDRDDNG